MKIALWNANSGLELKEICRNDKMDLLIVEGLQVLASGKNSENVLKMIPMGPKNSKPFPHFYRFFKEKSKGAFYGEFLDVSELGEGLQSCKLRHVKLMLQVKIESNVKMTRRKMILLSTLLWNSFLSDGNHYERPFGSEIAFDGIHFVYDKSAVDLVGKLIKNLRETAWNDEKEIILSSAESNFNFNPNRFVKESNFVITNDSKSIPSNISFAVTMSLNEKNSHVAKKYEGNKSFYGTVKILCKMDRLGKLKRLISRNPKPTDSEGNWTWLLVALTVGLVLILVLIGGVFRGHLWRRRRDKSKLKGEDDSIVET